jgi:hypothetical protein
MGLTTDLVVSLPTHRPCGVANIAWAPTPRVRPGFQDRGSPLTGSGRRFRPRHSARTGVVT